MLQTLNQFNEVEQSRFEAFKRCALSGDAISKFVAASLLDSNKVSSRHRINQINLIGGGDAECFDELPPSERAAIVASGREGATASTTTTTNATPRLEELVAPGSASKITAVVSTLAKIYAQRLVQSARAIATNEGYDVNKAILPHHLMEAHRIRSQHGQGFFMQSPQRLDWINNNACGVPSQLDGHAPVALGIPDKNRIKMQAALEAQKLCDEMLNNITEESENEEIHQTEVDENTAEKCN